jgi:hypothetical protein
MENEEKIIRRKEWDLVGYSGGYYYQPHWLIDFKFSVVQGVEWVDTKLLA